MEKGECEERKRGNATGETRRQGTTRRDRGPPKKETRKTERRRKYLPRFFAAASFSISFIANACRISPESCPALRRSFYV